MNHTNKPPTKRSEDLTYGSQPPKEGNSLKLRLPRTFQVLTKIDNSSQKFILSL